MLVFSKENVAILLLGLTQSLVFASVNNEKERIVALAETMGSLLHNPWINRVDTVLRLGTSCANEVAALIQASGSGQIWALEMLDASSKIQSGILQGNIRDLGMYDQCIGVHGEYNDTIIQGKYCTVSLGPLSSAICVPSNCNETDMIELLNAVIQNITSIDDLEFQINGVSCMPLESENLTVGELVTIFFFASIGVFVIMCTFCEFALIYQPKKMSHIIRQLAKFSLYSNAIALLSTEINPRMMPAVQGIRFFSMAWVVLGHRYLNTLERPVVNSFEFIDWYNSWTAVYIQAAPFAVDTFFVISGFLMSYFYLKSKKTGKRSNFPMMYIHRYLRLTPCIAILMLFVAVLLHRLGDGPLWNSVLTAYVEPCRKNWWINLFYVQNLVRVDEMCLLHSWYLAVDMQLFWISPFILYPLYRWPRYGLGLLGLFLLSSVVVPAVVLPLNRYSNALIRLNVPEESIMNDFLYFYVPTYNRACAYFVGILLGYDAATGKRHLSKLNIAINWTVTCILMVICGLSTQRVYNTILDYDVVLETAFAVLLRPFWSVAIAWIVYACCFGYGGVVTRFLSLPIFLPLSRLSYCIYLVHMVLQAAKISATRIPGIFSDIITFNYFWVDFIWSIIIAFIFSLFFESPVIVLEKMLTTRAPRPDRPKRELKVNPDGGIDNKGMTDA